MTKSASILRQPRFSDLQNPFSSRSEGQIIDMDVPRAADSHRYFALQPILTVNRQVFAYEALYRAGWESQFSGDPDLATRIMIDNWLLYGFEDLTDGGLTFLNCTREALVSGSLTLLPRWAVFEILESVEPDDEVIGAIKSLKALGYLISLDDFVLSEKMAELLKLADFIKIDFRETGPAERSRILNEVRETGITLIAEKIETEAEYRSALWEGFQLFQGYYFLERASFAMSRDSLHPMNCLRLLETLQRPGFPIARLGELLDREPGLAARLLRSANWLAERGNPVNSIRDALRLLGKNEFRKLVRVAIRADNANWDGVPPDFAWIGGLDDGKDSNAWEAFTRPGYGNSHSSQANKINGRPGKVLKMSRPGKDDL